jgi:uncharacterized DUF497 family protein
MGKSPYFQHVSTVVSGDYEWNEAKARTNLAKHAVSFDEAAAALASDSDELATPDPQDPSRTLSLVMSLRARVLLVVTTDAGDRTRIISARKAEPHEQRIYDQEKRV